MSLNQSIQVSLYVFSRDLVIFLVMQIISKHKEAAEQVLRYRTETTLRLARHSLY